MTVLYVDADACPVKDEVVKVAGRHGLSVVMVSNGGIRPSRDPSVRVVVVPEGPDVADKWIADRAGPGDLVVTADVPLAARAVENGALAIGHRGEPFTAETVGARLAVRDLMADIRAADPLGTHGGGRPFGRADRSRFLEALDRMVRTALRS